MPTSESNSIKNARHKQLSNSDIALIVASAPLLAASLRLWIYSAGDMSIFLTLLRTLDVTTILVATIFQMIPFALMTAAIILLTDWRARDFSKDIIRRHIWILSILFILLAIASYTLSWQHLVPLMIILVLSALYFIIDRYWVSLRRYTTGVLIAKRGDGNTPNSVLTAVVLLLLFLTLPQYIWLPLEQISTTSGEEHRAYVLESGSEWTTIITLEKDVYIKRTSDIQSRDVCKSNEIKTIAMIVNPSDSRNDSNCDE